MQKIVCPSYLFCNFYKYGSLELGEELTNHYNWVINAVIEFAHSIKLIQINLFASA